jgi:hypothetical protein
MQPLGASRARARQSGDDGDVQPLGLELQLEQARLSHAQLEAVLRPLAMQAAHDLSQPVRLEVLAEADA